MHSHWQKVTSQQLKELARLRRLMCRETMHLEWRIKQESASNDPSSQKMRDAAIADLLKVSQVHMKIMAQEQDLLRMLETADGQGEAHQELSAEDWLLLETVIQKRRQHMLHDGLARAGVEMIGVNDGE